MWECANCGEKVEDNFDVCWNCQTEKGSLSTESYFALPKSEPRIEEEPVVEEEIAPVEMRKESSTTSRSPFVKRYVDLYRTARLLNGLGTFVKVVAFILGIIIFLFWFFVGAGASAMQQQSAQLTPGVQAGPLVFYVCLVMGAVWGALTTGLFFFIGVLISAQGQLLKAQADCAVHTSPFLTNDERAAAMSL